MARRNSNTVEIPLSGYHGVDRYALVDKKDYKKLSKFKWNYHTGYAATSYRDWSTGKIRRVLMHRMILKPRGDEEIDHINRDRLDNRRSNLRICDRATNIANSSRRRGNITRMEYKGRVRYYSKITVYARSYRAKPADTKEEAEIALQQLIKERNF